MPEPNPNGKLDEVIRRLEEQEEEVVEVAQEFYEQNREEINRRADLDPNESMSGRGSSTDPKKFHRGDSNIQDIIEEWEQGLEENKPKDNSNSSLGKKFDEKIENRTSFSSHISEAPEPEKAIKEVAEEEKTKVANLIPDDPVLQTLEKEAYDLYHQVAAETANSLLEAENIQGVHLTAGEDYAPGVKMAGNWCLVDQRYDNETREYDGVEIRLNRQDLTEGAIAEIGDGEKNVALVTTIGHPSGAEELEQDAFEAAYKSLEEEGVLITSYKLDDDRFEYVETVEQIPPTYSHKVEDQYSRFSKSPIKDRNEEVNNSQEQSVDELINSTFGQTSTVLNVSRLSIYRKTDS